MKRSVVMVAGLALSGLLLMAPTKPTDRLTDRVAGGALRVEIEGVAGNEVAGIGGMTASVEVIEYQEGEDRTLRKRPGRTKHENLVLQVPPNSTLGRNLWTWYKEVAVQGRVARRSVSVIFVDAAGKETHRYNFFNAFPVKWSVPSQEAVGGANPAVEEVELAVERMDLVSAAR